MSDHLSTYLNDHLAGAAGALELLDLLRDGDPDTPVVAFASNLKREITADRQQLERLMESLRIEVSGPRKAAAWVAEKLTRLKMRIDDKADGMLRRLEILEAISVGIAGKQLLWRSLGHLSQTKPELRGPDYGRLDALAEEQRKRIEAYRLQAASLAMSKSPVGATA